MYSTPRETSASKARQHRAPAGRLAGGLRLSMTPPQSCLTDMSSTNTKPRAGSSALAPGITLFEKTLRVHDDGSRDTHLVARASAQIEGTQKVITRGVETHGLEEALRQVCEWRFEHAPSSSGYESAGDLLEEALANVQSGELE
jgi:hypothetical protein